MVNKKYFGLYVYFFILLSEFNYVVLADDHGDLSPKHIQTTEDFFSRNIKSNGKYCPIKIQRFIEVLTKDRNNLQKDIFETTLIEKIELELDDYSKAQKKAKNKSEILNEMIIGYDEYLLPKMKRLHHLVVNKVHEEEWNTLTHDFARGYIPYFISKAHRSPWPTDADGSFLVKKLFIPYKFKEFDRNKSEATNLMVETYNQEELSKCIGKELRHGYYLNPNDIKALQDCRYDLSKLNPGVSSLWHPLNESEKENIHQINLKEYPTQNQEVFFKKVSFKGLGSPKIKVFFDHEGEKKVIKLKTGNEVHTDKATSKIMELTGLNQDQMQYRKDIKVNLGKTSYASFVSQFANKYGIETISRYISAHGGSPGAEWVVFKDILLESRPKSELRVSSFDITSWDLLNRREFRSLLVLWGWLGINDIKPANLKSVFRKTKNGLVPLLRLHDTGLSMGSPFALQKPKHVLGFRNYYRVNAFPTSFIKQKNRDKSTIKIVWNDFTNRKSMFSQSSWSDLKWMARKIADIDQKDIFQALTDSGMPNEVADIFHKKLLIRRNEIVNVFSLGGEYESIPVPDLETYNPEGGTIVNGKVVKIAFNGKNQLVHLQNKWSTLIPSLISFNIPVSEWDTKNSNGTVSTELKGLNGITSAFSLNKIKTPTAITTLALGIGIKATLSRKVLPNNHLMNEGGKLRLFKIVDSVSFNIGVDSPLLREFLKKIPILKADFYLKFLENKIEHIHYQDDLKKSYFSEFNLHRIFGSWQEYVANYLEPLETINFRKSLGISTAGGIGVYSIKPAINNEISSFFRIENISSTYLTRDEYGQIHFFQDKTKHAYSGLTLDFSKLDFFSIVLPFFSCQNGSGIFDYSMSDYILPSDSWSRDDTKQKWGGQFADKEVKLLKSFGESRKKLLNEGVFKKNFSLRSNGKKKINNWGAFFLINNNKIKSEATTQVELENLGKRYFYRYNFSSETSFGIKEVSFFKKYDTLVNNRKRTDTTVELDRDRPNNFVLIVRIQDYFRTKNKSNLSNFIGDLNWRFSKNKNVNFFRDFRLPPVEDTDDYKKVYAITRIFVAGKTLIPILLDLKKEQIKNLLKEHFFCENREISHPKISKSYYLYLEYKILKNIRKIKRLLKNDSKNNFKKIAKYCEKISRNLHIEIFGISFFKNIMADQGLYVMGEIYGVLKSFSSLQDLQQIQKRRFAGKSWGQYKVVPPIQKFLRKHRIVVPSAHIEKIMSDSETLGFLETGVAPNWEFSLNHNDPF
ncbi:MAG: hypothetical protein AB8G05_00425 [Oligoflexales bacterium]